MGSVAFLAARRTSRKRPQPCFFLLLRAAAPRAPRHTRSPSQHTRAGMPPPPPKTYCSRSRVPRGTQLSADLGQAPRVRAREHRLRPPPAAARASVELSRKAIIEPALARAPFPCRPGSCTPYTTPRLNCALCATRAAAPHPRGHKGPRWQIRHVSTGRAPHHASYLRTRLPPARRRTRARPAALAHGSQGQWPGYNNRQEGTRTERCDDKALLYQRVHVSRIVIHLRDRETDRTYATGDINRIEVSHKKATRVAV